MWRVNEGCISRKYHLKKIGGYPHFISGQRPVYFFNVCQSGNLIGHIRFFMSLLDVFPKMRNLTDYYKNNSGVILEFFGHCHPCM